MSIFTKNYVGIKKRFFKTKMLDFSKTLTRYKTIIVHPVMQPGKEIYCLPAITSIVDKKGEENVELLVDEKLKFFFENLPIRKTYYNDFSSPFSSNYKNCRKKLKKRRYDIFLEMNTFNDNLLTLFAIIPMAKIRICLDCSLENPVFNLVLSSIKMHSEVDRNNLILRPLGIKRPKKRIKWDTNVEIKPEKKKIGISLENDRLAVRLFSFLEKKGLNPMLFVNDTKKMLKIKGKIRGECLSLYPLGKTYAKCASCEVLITSLNSLLSIAILQKKRTFLMLKKGEKIGIEGTKKLKILQSDGDSRSLLKNVDNFIKTK